LLIFNWTQWSLDEEKNLGITFSKDLKVSQQCKQAYRSNVGGHKQDIAAQLVPHYIEDK